MPARIFLAPLDWGLGHATRCVPVVNALLAAGAEVELGASGPGIAFFEQEFPALRLHPLPDYNITYRPSGMRPLHLLAQWPRVRRAMRAEYAWLQRYVREAKIDAVISDNRFGIHSPQVHSVCLSHQLNVQSPGGFGFATALHRRLLHRFNEVWVPDVAGSDNLSGALGHGGRPLHIPQHFVGTLSRLQAVKVSPAAAFRIVVLLSGPEPLRTQFEELLLLQLAQLAEPVLVARGLPGQTHLPETGANITLRNHIPGYELQQLLADAELIISRSGYSTLCDVAAVGRKLIAVPTPGQTEQEYLARLLGGQQRLLARQQQNFDVCEALTAAEKLLPLSVVPQPQLLEQAVNQLLQQLFQK